MVGKVYVSRDAKNYNYVGLSDSASVLLDLRDNPVNARYIMIKNSSTETWVSIKEVSYNTLDIFLQYGQPASDFFLSKYN